MTEDSMEAIPQDPIEQIIDELILCKDVHFRSQQKDELELTLEEKRAIATEIFNNSKPTFLYRFGKNLKQTHLTYFERFKSDPKHGYEIDFYLTKLRRFHTRTNRAKDIKNRRYDALKKLIDNGNYFTETEMMKRNPLLYEQLIGQYLSEDEKKTRDNIDAKNITFVNLLLEGIDRDYTKRKRRQQEDDEFCMEEEEEEEEVEMKETKIGNEELKWGEFEESPQTSTFLKPLFQPDYHSPLNNIPKLITAPERQLLKDEFVTIMYQSFLDGKDQDFDYSTVDDNDEYDNIDIKTHDAEDCYFDSESPEGDCKMVSESCETSEDELDLFMRRLDRRHSVQQLSNELDQL